jgi:hypothetical protein
MKNVFMENRVFSTLYRKHLNLNENTKNDIENELHGFFFVYIEKRLCIIMLSYWR